MTYPCLPQDALPTSLLAKPERGSALMALVRPAKSRDATPEFCQGLLQHMQYAPFNPHELINPGYPDSQSLLDKIVELQIVRPPIKKRRCPAHLGDEASLGEEVNGVSPVDPEWVAGWILAAGADPWRVRLDPHGHSAATTVDCAMARGCTALIEAMLRTPNAPSASTILARQALDETFQKYRLEGQSWQHVLARQPVYGAKMLDVFAQAGASMTWTLDDVKEATPDVVAWWAGRHELPTDPADRKAVMAAWGERVKEHQLPPEHAEGMLVHLGLDSQEAERRRCKGTYDNLLSNVYLSEWPVLDTTVVHHRHRVTQGRHRGQWNVISAWIWGQMLRRNKNQYGRQAIDWEPLLNAVNDMPPSELQAMLHESWRPGITVKAFLGFGLVLGYVAEPGRSLSVDPHIQSWAKRLDLPPYVMEAWCVQGVEQAASLCVAMLPPGSAAEHGDIWDRMFHEVLAGPAFHENAWPAVYPLIEVLGRPNATSMSRYTIGTLAEKTIPFHPANQWRHAMAQIVLARRAASPESQLVATQKVIATHPAFQEGGQPPPPEAWQAQIHDGLDPELRALYEHWMLRAACPVSTVPSARKLRL